MYSSPRRWSALPGGRNSGNTPQRDTFPHDNAHSEEGFTRREGNITCGTLWWEGVGYVREDLGGEVAAYPEVCEDYLFPPCGAIGGSPLAEDKFDVVYMEVVVLNF